MQLLTILFLVQNSIPLSYELLANVLTLLLRSHVGSQYFSQE